LGSRPYEYSCPNFQFIELQINKFTIAAYDVEIVGRPPFEKGKEPYADYRIVTPGYFDAIGMSFDAVAASPRAITSRQQES